MSANPGNGHGQDVGPCVSHGDGVRLRVRVRPRASRSAVVGTRNGCLDIALRSPPVDGAANDELVRFISDFFGAPRRRVELAGGHTHRVKIVDISGLSLDEARRAISNIS